MFDDLTIIVDTREQTPWEFPEVETSTETLQTGDYSVPGFEETFAVERKSLDDLAGSLGRDRDRFEREIQRGTEFEEFVVVVEADRETVENYRDRKGREVPKSVYYSQIHPNVILGTTNPNSGWPSKYGIPFLWAGSREQARDTCRDLLNRWSMEYR